MQKFFAVAVGSAAALAGFAGAANASATIDLIWADTGTNQIGGITSPVSVSSTIILQVILTAGPAGSSGTGVSVDYSGAAPPLTVLGYASTPGVVHLPFTYGTTINTGSRIENLNSASLPPAGFGTGLPAGASAQLGTITFHKSAPFIGTFEIRSNANGPTDGVVTLSGDDITAATTFNNSVFIPEPSALTALGSGSAMLALLYRRRWYSVER